MGTTGAPIGRGYQSGVWTGTSFIIWGGTDSNGSTQNRLNTGGVYTLSSNSWTTTATTGAPSARRMHTAVWTGSKMIIWGGDANTGTSSSTNVLTSTGGVYDPTTNTWTAMTTTNAPTARMNHKAVWDVNAQKMIVWGGTNGTSSTYYNTGGMYDPVTNTWTATSTTGAPSARKNFTLNFAFSIGDMVFAGEDSLNSYMNTGGVFNSTGNSWTATSTSGTPPNVRSQSAEWNGTELMVFYGYSSTGGSVKTGKKYNPSTSTWTTLTSAGTARQIGCSVWSGNYMIVFGGIDTNTVASPEYYVPF
jgi:hypothetical protein